MNPRLARCRSRSACSALQVSAVTAQDSAEGGLAAGRGLAMVLQSRTTVRLLALPAGEQQTNSAAQHHGKHSARRRPCPRLCSARPARQPATCSHSSTGALTWCSSWLMAAQLFWCLVSGRGGAGMAGKGRLAPGPLGRACRAPNAWWCRHAWCPGHDMACPQHPAWVVSCIDSARRQPCPRLCSAQLATLCLHQFAS